MDVALFEVVVRWSSILQHMAVLLLSLAMHLILAVFSGCRRREDRGWKRVLVWVAYKTNGWALPYVMGSLYLETSPHEKLMTAFWVPFLLHHNARPDNVSAYTLDSDDASKRLIARLSFEGMGLIYILYRYIFADYTSGISRQAACIMNFLGIFKYLESKIARHRCLLRTIQRSFNKQRPTSSLNSDGYGGSEKLAELDDEEALLVSHDLFDICKGAFSDYSVEYMDRDRVRSMFSHGWKNMCKVVEMELSLMYDILYTKTAVVHTWGGYAIRLAAPPLTATALLLFWLHSKEGINIEEIVITYILFWATLLLDVRWLLEALVSSWTHSFFKVRSNHWFNFNHQGLCHRRWHKLRCFVVSWYISYTRFSLWLWRSEGAMEPKNYRRRCSSGTLGQHNLLDQCTGGRPDALFGIMGGKKIKAGYQYESRVDIEIPDYVKKLVFKNISARCFPALADPEQSLGNGMDNEAPPAPQVPTQPNMLPATFKATLSPVPSVDRPLHYLPGPCKQQADQAMPGTSKQSEPDEGDEDMRFPPELQEVILIWHIATDVFLRCNHHAVPDASQEHAKAIKAMSDYMMFLVVIRPEMLPGLKRCRLYEKTRLALDEIMKVANVRDHPSGSAAKEKDQLAMWMLKQKDHLKDPGSALWEDTQMINKEHVDSPGFATVWEGTQLAWVLLSKMPGGGKHCRSEITEEIARTVRRLGYWIPDLENPPAAGNTKGMLEFILDSWVRLLIYASTRCSRESHAKQLGYGGELTTMVWIITEHAKISVVKSNCPSFFL